MRRRRFEFRKTLNQHWSASCRRCARCAGSQPHKRPKFTELEFQQLAWERAPRLWFRDVRTRQQTNAHGPGRPGGAFGLRYRRRKRVGGRLVEHLERAGFRPHEAASGDRRRGAWARMRGLGDPLLLTPSVGSVEARRP